MLGTLFPGRRARSSISSLSPIVAPSTDFNYVALAPTDSKKHQNWRSSRLEVHDYICKYWLLHTKAVPPETNPFLEDLCLSQDPDFLPWAVSRTTPTERLTLAMAYAVTTNRVSLFAILWNCMCRESLRGMVGSNPCPGTSSSYLHIAAALSHESIANVLVDRGFGGFADSDRKSAAAIAVEAGQL